MTTEVRQQPEEQYMGMPEGFLARKVSPTPKSDLDFNMMTTDTVWGQDFIPQGLKNRLLQNHAYMDETGAVKLTRTGYWEIHGYYTRDLRLGNLDDGRNPFMPNELKYCQYHLDIAGDYLNYSDIEMPDGFVHPFLVHIRRVATIIELSHSKKGWFRTKAGTIREEYSPLKKPGDQEKRNWFGIPKKGEETDG